MKRFTRIFFTALLVLTLCASIVCAEDAAPSAWKFDHKVIIVCPWGEGGGADATLRALVPLLSEKIGQPIEVLNVTGGNGVNGASFVRNREADGYTFMLGTQSLLIQDVVGEMPFKFMDEFVPVARLVHAIDVIATSRTAMEERGYKTFSELRDYIKAHPFSISIGMLTRVGVDGLSFKQATEGLNILEVDYPTGGGMTEALIRGQIDLMVTGTQEITPQIEAGEIIPLLVLAEKRMNRYPNVECAKDLGINAFLGSERGIFAKKGTPQGAIDTLEAAITEITGTQAWTDFLQQGGYDERPGFANAADYKATLEAEYKTFTDMLKPAAPAPGKAPAKKAAAPSTRLAIIGFVMVLVLIICLIKKIVIPPIAFILLPTIAALAAGFDPLAINKFAASGISKMVSTVSLFVFSISFFSLMSDQGVFDPVVNFLIKKAGTNVTAVLCATAAVAVIGHLDGSGATTFIITITAMLPLFKKLKMDNRALMMLVCVAIGVMNVCPWGGPTIRAATVLETDPNVLWHRLLPVQGFMLAVTFIVAFLQSGIQKRRIKKLGLTMDDSAVEAKAADDNKPKVSTALQWWNFCVVVAVIVVLMMGLLNPAYTFMLALALTLPFNIKSLKEQNGKLKNYGVAAMSMVVTLFAAGIFTGVLSGTGMLNAMASAVVTVIPPALGRYTHFIVACFAVPLIMCLGTDSFYFGLLPVVVGIASQFGVNPMDVACVLLVAENVGVMISPLSPAMYLGLGLLEIDVGEHIKYSLAWIWSVSILAIVACIVLGVTPL
ncbi:MAG: TRAP transporter large permease subunit [Synergistaceae bacterium]|nr:TRAP transporter large permease subunit [Synergistaceae bacterium]